jgi:ubiquinone/menaquinone biosynthesis C-methylase UbiE
VRKTAEEVKAFFERVAANWDDMRLAYYDERVIEKMIEISGMGSATTVADVGTGTGFVAAGVAPWAGRVVAVDNSRAMLDVARANLGALGLTNVELVEGEVTALPLASDSVSAAFANMVMHHAEEPAAVLEEMARVVKPGGSVAVVDAVEHRYGWMREEHADIWLGFDREQIRGLFGAARLEEIGYESLGMQ